MVAGGQRDVGGRTQLETTEILVEGFSAWEAGENLPFKAYGTVAIAYQYQIYLFGKN